MELYILIFNITGILIEGNSLNGTIFNYGS